MIVVCIDSDGIDHSFRLDGRCWYDEFLLISLIQQTTDFLNVNLSIVRENCEVVRDRSGEPVRDPGWEGFRSLVPFVQRLDLLLALLGESPCPPSHPRQNAIEIG